MTSTKTLLRVPSKMLIRVGTSCVRVIKNIFQKNNFRTYIHFMNLKRIRKLVSVQGGKLRVALHGMIFGFLNVPTFIHLNLPSLQ